MKFDMSAEEVAFRDEVREFIRDNPPSQFAEDGMDGGYGSGAHSHGFMQALGARGWVSLTWPRRYGGQEQPFFFKLILLEELALAGAPFGPLAGLDQSADAFIRYGSERLKAELLPEIAKGKLLVWQGFSEPSAGSDLLSLRTRAQRDGSDYVLNGHKIWSSHAGIAHYGLVLARTDPTARRHLGVTMFVVANECPGVEIHPIKSMAGPVYHYEVFIDDVRVHEDYRLGADNEGFITLLKGLDSDRFWGRFYKPPRLKRVLGQLVEYAKNTSRRGASLWSDAGVRRQVARLATEIEVLRTLFWRCGWMLREGEPTPYETAMYKVQADELGQKVAAFAMELLGSYGNIGSDSPFEQLDGEIRHLYLTSMGQTIAGGTSEVLRSTVATRGLGMPRASKPV
ncbi:MAG: hypothetical protein HOI95_00315 [Chromatiales bacterium]|jgi:3-oxocholest-4-en-26-oyl-CoA dehydrogenase alpha subunit|nr:hypothetical protein [Chromatiales bacterium]